MNDKAEELILNLSQQGKSDDLILKQLIYSAKFQMNEEDAVNLVAKTLKKKKTRYQPLSPESRKSHHNQNQLPQRKVLQPLVGR